MVFEKSFVWKYDVLFEFEMRLMQSIFMNFIDFEIFLTEPPYSLSLYVKLFHKKMYKKGYCHSKTYTLYILSREIVRMSLSE